MQTRELLLAGGLVLVSVVVGFFGSWLVNAVNGPGFDQANVVPYATTTVKCGDTSWQISTGTKGGACASSFSGGKQTGSSCEDGKNMAEVDCGKNDGKGACLFTQGSGSCLEIKAKL